MGICSSNRSTTDDDEAVDSGEQISRVNDSSQQLLVEDNESSAPNKLPTANKRIKGRSQSEEAILSAVHDRLGPHDSNLDEIPEEMLASVSMSRADIQTTDVSQEKAAMEKVVQVFESQAETFEGLPMLDFQSTCYCWEELKVSWSKGLATRIFNDLDTEKNSHISFIEFIASIHAIDPTYGVYWRPVLKLDPDEASDFLPFPQVVTHEPKMSVSEAVEIVAQEDANHAIRARAITTLSDSMFGYKGGAFIEAFTPHMDIIADLVHTKAISIGWYICFQLGILAFCHADDFVEFAVYLAPVLLDVVRSGHILIAQSAQNTLRVFAAQVYDPSDRLLDIFVDGARPENARKVRKSCIKCITDLLDRPDTARKNPDDPFWKKIEGALGAVIADESNLAPITAKAVHKMGKHNSEASSNLKKRASAVIQNEISVIDNAAKKLQFDLDEKQDDNDGDDEEGQTRREIGTLVHTYDNDDSGLLEINEIEQVFRDMKHTAPELDTVIVRRELDPEHRGQIVVGEFIDFYIAKWGPHGSRRTSRIGADELPRAVTYHQSSSMEANRMPPKVTFSVAMQDNRISHSHKRSGSAHRLKSVKSGPLTLEGISRQSRAERRNRAQRRSMMMQRKHITTLLENVAREDGSVSLTEVESMWSELTTEASGHKRTISGVKRALDPNNSGFVTVQSFSQWWYHDQVQTKKVQSKFQEELQSIDEDAIRAAFNKVDQDEDGLIGLQDFCLALEDLKIRWSLDDAKKIFKQLDEKKTKNIDYEEFRHGLFELHTDQMEVFWKRLLGHEKVEEENPEETEMKRIQQDDRMSLDEFFELSTDIKSDWRRRVKGLNDFSSQLCDASMTPEQFIEIIDRFKDNLAIQIQERRSQVARVACQNVGKIVAHHKGHFIGFVQFFMVALYQVVRQSSIKVSCESANKCCRAIVDNVPEDENFTVLNAIAEGIAGEYAYVRKCCFEYIGQLLEVMPSQEEIELDSDLHAPPPGYMDQIEQLLDQGVNDSDGKVRTAAFQALALLSLVDEERSDRLAENLTAASRRKFDRAKRSRTQGGKSSSGKSPGGRSRKGSVKHSRQKLKKERIRSNSNDGSASGSVPPPS